MPRAKKKEAEAPAEAVTETVQRMPLSQLHPFEGHPFKVLDDDAMTETVESIRQMGVANPLTLHDQGSHLLRVFRLLQTPVDGVGQPDGVLGGGIARSVCRGRVLRRLPLHLRQQVRIGNGDAHAAPVTVESQGISPVVVCDPAQAVAAMTAVKLWGQAQCWMISPLAGPFFFHCLCHAEGLISYNRWVVVRSHIAWIFKRLPDSVFIPLGAFRTVTVALRI